MSTAPVVASTETERPPHATRVPEVLAHLEVDPAVGLSQAEADERRNRVGPNELEEPPTRPRWLQFLDQFGNVLVALLVVGAVVAAAIGDIKDSVAIALVLLFNATLGYLQEQKAARNLDALRQMLSLLTRVRRDGTVVEVPSSDLVPGDILFIEAGDKVPADARVIEAWAAEVNESSLTGESVPSGKVPNTAVAVDAPLGDRWTMVFMNTQVTQGRIVAVVTATGMATEVGRVAELIASTDDAETPLQRQLDGLGKRLALISGAIVAFYFALGMARGTSFSETLISSVALLVAAIPEGLPAVVTLTLAVGTARLAKRGAIVKRLASVETLGSTSVICSDKTGTLTVNQMTLRGAWNGGDLIDLDGEGYDTTRPIDPDDAARLAPLLINGVLCNDSHIRNGDLIGDPTEGAIVAAALRAGIDVDAIRTATPRIGEVPFDSTRKLMITAHDRDGQNVLAVKGAWEVIAERSTTLAGEPLDAARRDQLARTATEMATRGLRVLAIADAIAPDNVADLGIDDLDDAGTSLDLLGLVGLLDPPRAEVVPAIAAAQRAGIAVKMVTGDHLQTATAIARQIGIEGESVSGHDLDAMTDAQLIQRIDSIGVIARVSPQHKVRIVHALRNHGEVVAMTGDGVNDAAALSAADIGIAMGDTGTEVAKDAADMVLADDDFTTITRAVEQGRTIYNNIVKFVRFQLATNIGALAALIGAQLAALPVPFNPIQLLWINIIMDGPPAMALGVDPDTPGEMDRAPRPRTEPILSPTRLTSIGWTGLYMGAVILCLLAWADHTLGTERALSLVFTAFVLMQIANALNVRQERNTIFTRATLQNRSLHLALAGVLSLQVLAIHIPFGQRIFGTVALTGGDWAIAVAAGMSLIAVEEVAKATRRRVRSSS